MKDGMPAEHAVTEQDRRGGWDAVSFVFCEEGMTMWYRTMAAATAGFGLMLLGGQRVCAQDDTFRLGGNIEAKTTTLTYDGNSEIELMRGVRGGVGGRGGFVGGRGGFVGGRGGFVAGRGGFVAGRGGFVAGRGGFVAGRGGFVGGRAVFVGGRGFVGWGGGWRNVGWGNPWWGGWRGVGWVNPWWGVGWRGGWGGGVWGGVGPDWSDWSNFNGFGCTSAYYDSTFGYPVSMGITGYPPVTYGSPNYAVQGQQQFAPESLPMPYPAAGGTFPYDGGPVNPIPMPKASDVPVIQPVPKIVLGNSSLGSVPAQRLSGQGSSVFTYPAYGDAQATFTRVSAPAAKATKKNK
jgi:hypothetical protein